MGEDGWLASIRDWVDGIAERSPARLVLFVFAGVIAVITALLCLPIATASGEPAPFVDALFTATSAVCVTGLVTVETAVYWSTFGHAVIVFGIAIGGLGVMTLSSILALTISKHIGLTQRMLTAGETKTERLGEVGSLVRAVLVASLVVVGVLTVVLFPRFLTLGESVPNALWHAFFMAESIFNNAGFVIMPEGLEVYVGDWWMNLPIFFGTFMGAVGFPVLLNVARRWRTPRNWTLHTKLTLTTYGILTLGAGLLIPFFERNNPATFGALAAHERILQGIVHSVTSRSSGLAPIDVSAMNETTWLLQDALMFVGGGSASTAGGLKVTTLAVLVLAIVAEARGDRDVEAFGRRIPYQSVRLAVAVAFLGATLVGISTLLLLHFTDFGLARVLYESISAFATCGLSTGITTSLPPEAKYVLTALMYMGRVGMITLAAALAVRSNKRMIRMPEERPSIG